MIPRPADAQPDTSTLLPLEQYDHIIVSFSGGKDSTACYLHLLDLGVPPERIEIWHQAVDGRPGHDPRFFDWPCTEAYCRAFAKAFGSTILFQWREGGFEREMNRQNAKGAPTTFDVPEGGRRQLLGSPRTITVPSDTEPNTRRKFPMPTGDLAVRWCSYELKIAVAAKVFTNDPRFDNTRSVMLTGERRQESEKRALYADVSKHRSSTRTRRVDQWRAVLAWEETEVWDIIRRYRVLPHPAYYLGWGRLSCMPCIFGNPDQFASVRQIAPHIYNRIVAYEHEFNSTIRMDGELPFSSPRLGEVYATWPRGAPGPTNLAGLPRRLSPAKERHGFPMERYVDDPWIKPSGELGGPGRSYVPDEPALIDLAMGEEYPADLIFVPEGHQWHHPLGAFKKTGGPT